MDYINFINSRDIREHLYETGYSLSDLQKFYLTDCCHRLNYLDKVKEFINLQDSCTDSRIEIPGFDEIKSLKSLLETVIKQREKTLADFKNPFHSNQLPSIYISYLYVKTKHDYSNTSDYEHGSVSEDFCLRGLFESAEEALKLSQTESTNHNRSLIKIEKRLIGSAPFPAPLYVAIYDMEGNLCSLQSDREKSLSYKEISINLPLPFSRGDLLIKPNHRFYRGYDINCNDYINLIYDTQLRQKKSAKLSHSCFIQGYSLNTRYHLPSKVNIEHEYDLEYSRSPLTGNDQLLIPFSMFLKGTLHPDELLNYVCGLKKAILNKSLENYLKECKGLKDPLIDYHF